MWELTAEAGKRYLVHEDVLTSQSQRLKDIVNAFAAAEPSPKREIPLDNWDANTVGRFVEYIYTGDYQSPDPIPIVASTPAMTPAGSDQGVNSEQSPEDSTTAPEDVKEEKEEEEEILASIPPARPLTPLSKCIPAGPDPSRKLSAAETFAEKYFDPSSHDFEEVFLTHAKVFAFAREFEMLELQTLAVQRLLRTFINIGSFQPSWPVASNFAELAKYSYGGNNPAGNDLRHIVSQFAALNFTTLQTDEVKTLIEQSGWFARDLTAKVCRRLVVAEKKQDKERKVLKQVKLNLQAAKADLEEERAISAELREKVADKKSSPSRPSNPLAGRKSSSNNGSVFGGLPKKPDLPDPGSIFAKAPPPPPNTTFPGSATFGTTTTTGLFSTTAAPVTISYFCRPKEAPLTGAGIQYISSSQPGAKSIFETENKAPKTATSLFAEPGAKSIFDNSKTPTRGSSSFGLFDTPPQSRSSSAFGNVRPTEVTGNFPDPVKQPASSSGLFGAPQPAGASSFGTGNPPSKGLFSGVGPMGKGFFDPAPKKVAGSSLFGGN